MTDDEALREAQRRWGNVGHVRHDSGATQDVFKVGVRDGRLFHVKGRGQTWEEAFKAAASHTK